MQGNPFIPEKGRKREKGDRRIILDIFSTYDKKELDE